MVIAVQQLLIQIPVTVAALNIPLLYCKELNNIHSQLFALYSEKFLSLIEQQIKDEDIRGESKLIPGTVQYQMANLLVTLFYNDFIKNGESLEYLLKVYKVDELRECFRCVGIDLKLMFDTVGIDILTTPVVPIIPPTGETVSIADLLSQNNSCQILIK